MFLCNSGAEANEAAIKLVAAPAAGRQDRGRQGRFPRPHLRRAVGDAAGVQAGPVRAAGAGLRGRPARIPRRSTRRSTSETAAVLLEPIQGETGINVLCEELLEAAREACDRAGAALIFDEIQTGMGRTGTLWAYEQTGVVPDALTTAKALGGGLPIGALVTGRAARRHVRARRPRLDLRRRPGRRLGRARRARDLLGPGAAESVRELGERLAARWRRCRTCARSAAAA